LKYQKSGNSGIRIPCDLGAFIHARPAVGAREEANATARFGFEKKKATSWEVADGNSRTAIKIILIIH
jgi:hypothetical protein